MIGLCHETKLVGDRPANQRFKAKAKLWMNLGGATTAPDYNDAQSGQHRG